MNILEAIESRHSVRSYTDKPIAKETLAELNKEIENCNRESGLSIRLVTDEPEAFSSFMARYGKFSGVKNYFAMIGKKGSGLDEKVGYYGEKLVLKAQKLGLNTCWAALTFSKKNCKPFIQKGEKLVCVIAVGYGATQGVQHKNKDMSELYHADETAPEWFMRGMRAAMLAPTATNQQKFMFSYKNGLVGARATGGFYSKVDLGIVKYHFEIGVGRENFKWEA